MNLRVLSMQNLKHNEIESELRLQNVFNRSESRLSENEQNVKQESVNVKNASGSTTKKRGGANTNLTVSVTSIHQLSLRQTSAGS